MKKKKKMEKEKRRGFFGFAVVAFALNVLVKLETAFCAPVISESFALIFVKLSLAIFKSFSKVVACFVNAVKSLFAFESCFLSAGVFLVRCFLMISFCFAFIALAFFCVAFKAAVVFLTSASIFLRSFLVVVVSFAQIALKDVAKFGKAETAFLASLVASVDQGRLPKSVI